MAFIVGVASTLAWGGPAVVLAVGAGLALVVLRAGAVEISQHAVARRLVPTRVGLAGVRGQLVRQLDTKEEEGGREWNTRGNRRRKE